MVVDLPSCSSALVIMIVRASRVERHEVQVRAQHPERFGLSARRVLDHHQLFGPSKALRRPRQAAEKWQTTQAGGDLLGRANPRLERLAEERETEAEHEADDEAERTVAEPSSAVSGPPRRPAAGPTRRMTEAPASTGASPVGRPGSSRAPRTP